MEDTVPIEDLVTGSGDDIRAAARVAVLQELESIGMRRQALLEDADTELERLGAFLSVAESAGIRQNEIAERANVSRQTLLNLRNEGRGTKREWNIDIRVMLVLAFSGAQSLESLTSLLRPGRDYEHHAEEALKRLCEAGAVTWAGAGLSGGDRQDYFKLTPQGVAELPGRLGLAAMPESRRWTAYVAANKPDAHKIVTAGEIAMGQYEVAHIPAATRYDMTSDEVAFHVEAPTVEQAGLAAAALYARLRKLAGLGHETARVMALLPPQSGARGRAA